MKVGELRKLIAGLPDNMLVVVSGDDHSYRMAYADTTDAEIQRTKDRLGVVDAWEYYSEEHRTWPAEAKKSTVEKVLWVGSY